jgi:hypothetical protein
LLLLRHVCVAEALLVAQQYTMRADLFGQMMTLSGNWRVLRAKLTHTTRDALSQKNYT